MNRFSFSEINNKVWFYGKIAVSFGCREKMLHHRNNFLERKHSRRAAPVCGPALRSGQLVFWVGKPCKVIRASAWYLVLDHSWGAQDKRLTFHRYRVTEDYWMDL